MRDAQRTRGKILAAAVAEIAEHGYAGARIDRIATNSGANKRMIYHHFGGKQAVFEAVLAERLTTEAATEEHVRLWMHEALERGDEDIVRFEERRRQATMRIDGLRAAQGRGELAAGTDPALFALARHALDVFPLAFPQLVRVATGNRANSEAFRHAWRRFLDDWYTAQAARPAKPRIRLDRDRVSQAVSRPSQPERAGRE